MIWRRRKRNMLKQNLSSTQRRQTYRKTGNLIPLLIQHRDGKWVLHYVTPDTAKEHIQKGTGIDYISVLGSYLKPYTITNPRLERLIGKYFTSWKDKNIVIDKLNENGINEVELADGTKFKSRFLVNLDENRIKLETIGKLKDGTRIKSNLEAKVTHDKFGRRELNIDKIEGYDTDSISILTALMQFKYRVIRTKTDIVDDKNLANFLLTGYGANIKISIDLIQTVKEYLKNKGTFNKIFSLETILKLNKGRTLVDIMNLVIETDIVNPDLPLIEKIVQHIKQLNPEHLEFHSTDWTGNVRYTSSQLTARKLILKRMHWPLRFINGTVLRIQ